MTDNRSLSGTDTLSLPPQDKEVRILAAAARLFAEKGFHRSTTKEIAQAADVSEGTLYNYFKNKNDILMGIMTHLSSRRGLSERLTSTQTDDVQETLHLILEERNNFVRENKAMLQAVYSEILVDPTLRDRYYRELLLPMITTIEAYVRTRIRQGTVKETDAGIAARLLVGVMNGLFLLSILDDEVVNQQWDIMDEAIVDLFFRGYHP